MLGRFFLAKKYRKKQSGEYTSQPLCRSLTLLWEEMLQGKLDDMKDNQMVNIDHFSEQALKYVEDKTDITNNTVWSFMDFVIEQLGKELNFDYENPDTSSLFYAMFAN